MSKPKLQAISKIWIDPEQGAIVRRHIYPSNRSRLVKILRDVHRFNNFWSNLRADLMAEQEMKS